MSRSRRPPGELIGAGVLTGALAGGGAGAIDAIWSWGKAAQFVPGLGGRLRYLIYVASSHALAGAVLAGVLTAIALGMLRRTRLGDLLTFLDEEHARRRATDPASAVAGLALTLAGIGCFALAITVAYLLALPLLSNRQIVGYVIIAAMAIALVAALVALGLTFVVGAVVEWLLAWVARKHPRFARVVSWRFAPVGAGVVLVGGAVAGLAIARWDTTRALPLRGPMIVVVAGGLSTIVWRAGYGLAVRLAEKLPRWRRTCWVVAPIAMFAIVLTSGGSPAVIKAATSHTGFGSGLTRLLRAPFDRDHDGFASVLGGGDCDDGDASVHPGAAENPDDGVDQNCVGGDPTSQRSFEPAFVEPPPPAIPKDFDVVLITIDTTRADHLGTYGYARATTPNLDKLGADGTVFEHAWAHAPSTRYSMPAILTGRLPLDVYYDYSINWPGILPKATTIAETLQALGIAATGAITNYDYFDPSRHMDQGFVEYDNTNKALHHGVSNFGPERTSGSSSKQQTDKAVAFVDKHAAERFFLWVHYYDPHYGYEPHPEVPSFGTDEMALYDGEIAFTDQQIGRLLAELRARGVYDKTVVVVTGDHGEGFGEHGIERHGYHLYAAQTKVPLIIRVPGLPPRRSTTPAGHVDILPTLANLAGGKPTTEMEGRSLVDALAGTDHERVVFQQLSYEGEHEMRGAASRACHVIYNVSPDTSWEVYRVDRDPMELHDLAGTDECADTRTALARWYDRDQVPAGAVEALLPARPAIATPLDADLGTTVRLLAVDTPPRARPGESIPITWTWEARGRVPPGWKVFAHLEHPSKFYVNGDHRPARPFEWWTAGQFIRYTTTLAIPVNAPRGTYRLMTGMFAGKGRAPARAPHATIENDAVAAATIEVSP
ncbi:MAG: sulfatase [Proteobacteria bacterium]|nr:sulfatase [Pseudomonadota bacterium]